MRDQDLEQAPAALQKIAISWIEGLSPALAGGAHWDRAILPPGQQSYTLPLAVAQLSNPGTVRRYIGGAVLLQAPVVLVRCIAEDLAAAQDVARRIAEAVPASGTLADPGGAWSYSTRAVTAPVAPAVQARQAQAIVAYQVNIDRSAP